MTHLGVGSRIKQLREELGLEVRDLARAARLSEEQLVGIEEGREAGSFDELRAVSRIVGVDLATYDPDEDAEPERLPSVTMLMKSARGFVPPQHWWLIAEAAQVAEDIVALEEALGRPARFEQLSARFSSDGRFGQQAWQDGRRLADEVRRGDGAPIDSMRKLCEDHRVAIIETWLPQGISALCLADRVHGPTIVLNLAGFNESAFVRRFTLAHELCHILFDRHNLEPLQTFDGYDGAYRKPAVEQRADAFAIHLLAPEGPFRAHWKALERVRLPVEMILRKLMELFGVSFQATRTHAGHLGLLSEEESRRISSVDTTPPDVLRQKEEDPTAGELFAAIPRERRGALLRLALEASSRGLIGQSKLLELLGVTAETFAELGEIWRSEMVMGA
jgi:Zn-dependent peptidase ImmA (M78 family)/DNA-binding XRE family transcriptional regulator